MDRDSTRQDARAVEDPIAAVFDLAESVERQTPTIRRVLRYVRWFVSLWLLLDFFLMILLAAVTQEGRPAAVLVLFFPVTGLLFALRYASKPATRLALLVVASLLAALQAFATADPIVGGLLAALFVLGFVILDLMRSLRSFFDFFALRHRVITAVRSADPIVHVPQGKDAAARIVSHLAATDRDVAAVLAQPSALTSPALLTGKSGLTYSFDAYLRAEPSTLARTLGIGPAGFAIFAKSFDHPPGLDDLKALRAAAEDVARATRIPPARILALWEGNASIAPDAYEFLTHESARVTIRGTTYACSLESVREGDDGTYDFIPVVVGSPTPAARTAPA